MTNAIVNNTVLFAPRGYVPVVTAHRAVFKQISVFVVFITYNLVRNLLLFCDTFTHALVEFVESYYYLCVAPAFSVGFSKHGYLVELFFLIRLVRHIIFFYEIRRVGFTVTFLMVITQLSLMNQK